MESYSMYVENNLIVVFFTMVNAVSMDDASTLIFDKLWELGAVITASLVGIVVGAHVSGAQDRKRRELEIEKVRLLLNDEFNRLLELTIEVMTHTKDFKIKLTTEEYVNTITSDDQIMKNAVMNTILPFKFAYWKSLESSGSLVRLEAREIQLVQSVHDYIVETNNNSENNGLAVRKEVDAYFPEFTEGSKKYWINNTLIPYLDVWIPVCEKTYNVLYTLTEINWITFPNPSYQTTDTEIQSRRKVIDSHGSWEWV